MEGTVKWYNRKKGYGFILGEDDKEYFVHYTAIAKGKFLRDNDKVAFEADNGEKGPMAKNVLLLQKASEFEGQEGAEPKTETDEAPVEEAVVADAVDAEEAPAEESADEASVDATSTDETAE